MVLMCNQNISIAEVAHLRFAAYISCASEVSSSGHTEERVKDWHLAFLG